MAVSNLFPNEILWHVVSVSSFPTLVQVAQTCTHLYNGLLRMIENRAAPEQLRMGMPAVPFTFANVHFIVQKALRTWINHSPEECGVIQTNIMNQPLVFYARLNPLAAIALDNLSDQFSINGYAHLSWNPYADADFVQREREQGLFQMVGNENLPWDIALEVAYFIQNPEDPAMHTIARNHALADIASRADVPWEKALEIAYSIASDHGGGLAQLQALTNIGSRTDIPPERIIQIVRSLRAVDRSLSNRYPRYEIRRVQVLSRIASRADLPREYVLEIVRLALMGHPKLQNDVLESIASRDAEIASMVVDQVLDAMDQSPTVEEIVISPTERAALLQLKDMIQQSEIQYSDEDYLSIMEGLSGETQGHIYEMLYQAHDSPFGDIDKDGIQRILSNPKLLLPIIHQLT